MIRTTCVTALAALAFSPQFLSAQLVSPQTGSSRGSTATSCIGAPLTGTVRDTTAAIIPGASLSLDAGVPIVSASDGSFRLPCVPRGRHSLHIAAPSFASKDVELSAPHTGEFNVVLLPDEVTTTVDVAEDAVTAPSATASGPSQTLAGKQLSTLADDPDDLLRELQQLAAAAGGSPSSATIAVDGFDNGEGGAHLPPKSSIAYIKVNPDLFSAEYRDPPFGGGRIEIYTKPGQSTFHGALFATNSSSFMNARDPFSTAATSLGKQRYGFELTGPIRKKGSDFFTSLEHRSISNDAVVDAITVNAAGTQSPLLQTVTAPQQLWVGNAKVDWQLGPKNTLIVSFDSFNNNRMNAGVGGTSLLETGYGNSSFDYNLHVTNVTTFSPKIMHETRVGYQYDGYTDTPNSSAPQVSVAGAFTGGGSTLGQAHEHEIWSTLIDDVIIQTRNHLIKIGIQPEFIHIHQHVPTNFNGSYSFGGGTTSTGATITGIQQYVNALNHAPNGAPTTFSNVTGTPEIDVFQFRNAAFYQDDWKVAERLHFSYGVRFYSQTDFPVTGDLQPRFGVAWSPDKKSTWSLHAHAGTFAGRYGTHNYAQFRFMDGTDRTSNTVYNPSAYCPSGIVTGCNPLNGATTVINTVRTLVPNFPNTFWASENVGFTKTFLKGFSLSGDYYLTQMWHYARSENINAPTNGSPTGPRPFGPDLNILQIQGTGRGYGNVIFMGLGNQALKRVQFFAGAVRVDIIDDTDDGLFFTPQTTGVNTGEYARRDNQGLWNVFGNVSFHLPTKVILSANYHASGLQPYNVTTGFDNNGDGDFNDRPRYAPAGTPLCATNPTATPCAYATPWGLLTSSGNGPTLSRDKGMMPWTVYLDTNLQRTFTLTPDSKSTHVQTLAINLRSSNVLNHENVTAVGSVLGSPLFGVPYAADNGRRVEGGIRYSF